MLEAIDRQALYFVSNRKASDRKAIDETIGRNLRLFLCGANHARVDAFTPMAGMKFRMTRNDDGSVTVEAIGV